MQSELDRVRIIAMGAPEKRVRVTGSMKFDMDTDTAQPSERMKTLLGLGSGEKLFVAGSTHRGEEEMVLDVYRKLSGEFPGLRLLIAPRHVERADEVERTIRKFGFTPVPFSKSPVTDHGLQVNGVFLLDTIGQLREAYSTAAIVFIGGSMVRHGGQNPIEPAVFGKVAVFGPHMFNFRAITDLLLSSFGAIQVGTKEELLDQTRLLLKNDTARERFGHNARRVVLENRGATGRNLEAIEGIWR
jgi:3-deoxy-D-manno-octulosonic-acid transferase